MTNARPRALPAERAAAEAPEPGRAVERRAVEVGHDVPAPLGAVFLDRLDELPPQILESAEIGDRARPEAVGQSELRARLQPGREVVSLSVIGEAGRRNGPEHLLQRLQVVGPAHLGAIRQAEEEVAEAEVLDHEVPELLEENGRAFQVEGGAHLLRERRVFLAAGLKHERDVGLLLAHPSRQLHAGQRGEGPAERELDVGDDPEDVLPIRLDELPGLLEVAAEEDLRPRLEPHELVREVDPLGDEVVRVVDHLGVEHGQEGRGERDAVLDEDDRLDALHARVVREVHAVLDDLHDGEEDPHVSAPQVDPVERRDVVPLEEEAELAVVVGEEDDMGLHAGLLEPAGEARGIHVADVQRRDDEVEAGLPTRLLERLLARRDAGDAGNVPEVQLERFGKDPLVELAVFREDEVVVQAGDEQDVLDPVLHQFVEPAPRTLRAEGRVVRASFGHRLLPERRRGGRILHAASGAQLRRVPGRSSRRRL